MAADDSQRRSELELPAVIAERGWRFHHLGIPTTDPRPGERRIPGIGMLVSGFETSPFGIEWMRFEAGSPVHELIQRVPHLAFVVDDLDSAVEGFELLGPPTSPMEGIRVAMIVHDGAPVELMELSPKSG
jgi:hypothetical protein